MLIPDNEFYFLVKVQVSDEAIELAERAGFNRHAHAEDVGNSFEMSIRQDPVQNALIDNMDTRPIDPDMLDLEDGLLLLVGQILDEEWDGDDKIRQFIDHLDSLRLMYNVISGNTKA